MENFDLKKITNDLINYEQRTQKLMVDNDDLNFDSILKLMFILNNIYPTFVAPAYHLNRYKKLVLNPYSSGIFNDLKGKVAHSILQVEFQDTLIAIKGLLDRIVKILSINYRGISIDTTFGYIDSKSKKGRGFMKYAGQAADKDELMEHFYKEYFSWIKKCVEPRDKIVHFNDLPVVYKSLFNPNNGSFNTISIVHLNKNM